MLIPRWTLFLAIVCFVCRILARDDIQFEHFSLDEGLSQSTVRCIFQDSRGFMWFGTWDGLNRFDGYNFKIYKHVVDDSTSLSAKSVLSMAEDQWGRLWIGTTHGLNRFDRFTEKFTQFLVDSTKQSISNNAVWAVCADTSSALWIGTDGGLDKLVFDENGDIIDILHIHSDSNDVYQFADEPTKCLLFDPAGALWIGTWHSGLYRLDLKSATFLHFWQAENMLSNFAIRDMSFDTEGNLWLATHFGLNKLTLGKDFDFQNPKLASFDYFFADGKNPFSLNDNELRSVRADLDGNLWIGTKEGGVNCLDPRSGKITRYKNDKNNPHSLSHNEVHSMYRDRTGVLWFGTFGGGVNKYNPAQKKFRHFYSIPDDKNSPAHNFIMCMIEDSYGEIWIGTWDGGLDRIEHVDDNNAINFEHYTHNPSFSNSVPSNIILSFFEDQNRQLWIGTWEAGLVRYDRNCDCFHNYTFFLPDNPLDNDYNKVFSIIEDRRGILWMQTAKPGLLGFDPQTNKHILCLDDPKNPSSINNNLITSLFRDKDGRVWIGTQKGGVNVLVSDEEELNPRPQFAHDVSFVNFEHASQNAFQENRKNVSNIYQDSFGRMWIGTAGGGLDRIELNNDRLQSSVIKNYSYDPDDSSSINGNFIGEIFQDSSGTLWIEANGLNKFDPTTEMFTCYGEKYGLHNIDILAMFEGDGFLWIITATGLSRFHPDSETIRHYDVYDGLQSREFNTNAHLQRQNSDILLGGVNGFNLFRPRDIEDDQTRPNVVITDFLLSNKSVSIGHRALSTSISEAEEIHLTYDDRVFSFEFAALHYGCQEKNQYAYKMDGLDNDWNYIGTRRFTTFTNLSPGRYQFQLKGSNGDGVWNDQDTSIRIIISPPWWRSALAYLGYVSASVLIVWTVIGFLVNRSVLKRRLLLEQEHAAKLEELDRMKSRFFANISHEFRTPLTLILGPLENLLNGNFDKNVKNQFTIMLRNGQRLLRLINQLLDLSKMESGRMSIKVRQENIVGILKTTVRFFSSWAERKNISIQLLLPNEEIDVYLDRDKIEKVLSNLLSNAFKFTPKGGDIIVSLALPSSDFITISVLDSGPGIESDRLDKIFDRFYQVDDSQTRDQEGTGIGLALTKELVELHHGTISVQSPPPDKESGSIFTIQLRRAHHHFKPDQIVSDDENSSESSMQIEPVEPQQETNEKKTTKNNAPLLLIVEDNQDVRDYMFDILQNDYNVNSAVDGLDGFENATATIPDLIVSDVMMPKMDGFELCHKLKNDERTSHIPIILLTARATGDSKVEGLETGADDYLIKPFDAKELCVRIKNLIDGRQKLRERFSKEITLQPQDITVTSMDEAFLQRVMDIIENYISDSEFTTTILAEKTGLSRMQLNRKLQALTGQSTRSFITKMRLKRAAQLLHGGAGTVSEIVYDVGFNNLSHFAKSFRKQFGVSPSEYAAQANGSTEH